MNIYQAAFASLLVIAVVGDVGYFFQSLSASPGQELSRNSYSMISGSEAFASAVKALGKIAKNLAKKSKGHTKNKTPSNREKHQKGDRRRKQDQSRSDGQKGGKGGNKRTNRKNKRKH